MNTTGKINRIALAICAIGLVVNFVACAPGYMTGDTLDQYRQSLSGVYSNWHPPIMAAWWRCLNVIYSGPQVMLGFQLACFWAGIYLLYNVVKGNRWWYLPVTLFAFAPFVQNFSGYIIKDSQMAIVWLLACVWMLHVQVKQRKAHAFEIVACALLLVYGCWIRLNALPGFVPLCFLWAYTFFAGKNRGMKMVYALCLLLVSVSLQPVVQNNVLHAKKGYPEIKLCLHDLSGIFVLTGENVFPSVMYENRQFDTAYIRAHYSVTSFDNIWWNKDSIKIVAGDEAVINDALSKQWQKEVLAHPVMYLSNRLDGFAYYLRIKNSGSYYYYNIDFIDENEFGFRVGDNALHHFWQTGVNLHAGMPYMRPWFWLLLNIVLLFFVKCVRDKAGRIVYAALVWSSLLYFMPMLFLFQVDFEFRYTYWNCVACSLSVLILIAERLEKERVVHS
jgi:hypothetical protein